MCAWRPRLCRSVLKQSSYTLSETLFSFPLSLSLLSSVLLVVYPRHRPSCSWPLRKLARRRAARLQTSSFAAVSISAVSTERQTPNQHPITNNQHPITLNVRTAPENPTMINTSNHCPISSIVDQYDNCKYHQLNVRFLVFCF